ncbi:hypothetical protein CEV34_2328 [Brucella pseudogrignonensis]|uniref:Uncharacterized protein n=1 Tax=Brucella pseudogrignonensis TaxID=419475 RepID=A0A256GHY2_9HYPH|nr:hypothetical protein CEV34_2328 [Brucella pseudogrignonensis]
MGNNPLSALTIERLLIDINLLNRIAINKLNGRSEFLDGRMLYDPK